MHQSITATVALALAFTGLAPPAAPATASRVPVRIVYVSGRNGIDWGAACVGAAAGAGITLLGLGGALAVSQRHAHQTTSSRQPGAHRGSPRPASQSSQKRSDLQ